MKSLLVTLFLAVIAMPFSENVQADDETTQPEPVSSPSLDSGISPTLFEMLKTITHALTDSAAVTKALGARVSALEARLPAGKSSTAGGQVGPNIYLSLESPDGTKSKVGFRGLDEAQDPQMPGSSWHCFWMTAYPTAVSMRIRYSVRCELKAKKTAQIILFLEVPLQDMNSGTASSSSIFLVKENNTPDYRLELTANAP